MSVESNAVVFGFALLCSLVRAMCTFSTNPAEVKTKTNCDLLARVLPRLALITCLCFNF